VKLRLGMLGNHDITLADLPEAEVLAAMAQITASWDLPEPTGHLRLRADDQTEVLISLRDIVIAEVTTPA
jgi:hypothetical protein